ncbi:hypothetical protein [Streptomyces sp. NPDC058964]|uniref:hypothetical protein n=1 Tax=Streptomyces sp. NPDC058964 TaxID=3346681 RepID=UPI00367453C9
MAAGAADDSSRTRAPGFGAWIIHTECALVVTGKTTGLPLLDGPDEIRERDSGGKGPGVTTRCGGGRPGSGRTAG